MSISRDTFDPTKNYKQIRYHQDRDLLDSELNEQQEIINLERKKIADMLFKEGAVISGLGVSVIDNVVTVAEGIVYVDGYQRGHYQAGLSSARDAEVLLGIAGGDDVIRAQLYNNLGGLLYRKGEHDEALTYFRRSLAIQKQLLGTDHPRLAKELSNMGAVISSLGKYELAMKYFLKSQVIFQNALGPEHPHVAQSLLNLGIVFENRGEFDKALDSYSKALAIWEKVLGADHHLLAWPLSGIGKVFVFKNMAQEALAPLERLVQVCETKICQPEPKSRGLFSLARALIATGGDKMRAIRLAIQARDAFENKPKAYLKDIEEINGWLEKMQ